MIFYLVKLLIVSWPHNQEFYDTDQWENIK